MPRLSLKDWNDIIIALRHSARTYSSDMAANTANQITADSLQAKSDRFTAIADFIENSPLDADRRGAPDRAAPRGAIFRRKTERPA